MVRPAPASTKGPLLPRKAFDLDFPVLPQPPGVRFWISST
jgi:hypothetical protein